LLLTIPLKNCDIWNQGLVCFCQLHVYLGEILPIHPWIVHYGYVVDLRKERLGSHTTWTPLRGRGFCLACGVLILSKIVL
jgi:hypothetical protein